MQMLTWKGEGDVERKPGAGAGAQVVCREGIRSSLCNSQEAEFSETDGDYSSSSHK